MHKIKEIAFTAYPVTDVTRARAFYGGTLGLTETVALDFGDGHWSIEYDIGAGTLVLSTHWSPAQNGNGPSIALEVEDLDATLALLEANNVKQDGPIVETPVCRFLVATDPDGNGLIFHQHKK